MYYQHIYLTTYSNKRPLRETTVLTNARLSAAVAALAKAMKPCKISARADPNPDNPGGRALTKFGPPGACPRPATARSIIALVLWRFTHTASRGIVGTFATMAKKRLSRRVTVAGPVKGQILGTSRILRPLEEAKHGAKAQAEARKRAEERLTALTTGASLTTVYFPFALTLPRAGLDPQSLRVLAELQGDPTEFPDDPTDAVVDAVMTLDSDAPPGHTGDGPAEDDLSSDLWEDEAVAHALRDLLDPR